MKASDKPAFFSLLADVHDMYGATCSPQAAALWFDTLRVQELDQLREAFMAHSRHPQFGRYPPKPADVMREIEANVRPEWMLRVI